MIDISKPENKEVLLKLGLSESKIEEFVTRQKNGEILPKRIIITNSEEKKVMITLPDSPEEIEEKKKIHKEIKTLRNRYHMEPRIESLKRRFLEKVNVKNDTECWFCKVNTTEGKYGFTKFNGKSQRVSRISYFLHCGDVPDEKEVRHICGNWLCVNPKHLILETSYKEKTIDERFWEKVNKKEETECWDWKAAVNSDGYGSFNYYGKILNSQRACWILIHGEIPEGKHVCHSCNNPMCVNPNHLYLDTHKGNMEYKIKCDRCNVPRGEDHPRAKLTDKEVKEIKEKSMNGISAADLSREYEVTRQHIGHILHNRNRKNLIQER